MYKVYIKYRSFGYDDGPFSKRFDNQKEAMDWIKSNEIELLSIEFIED